MKPATLNIIGPGKLGKALGCLFANSGNIRISGVYSRDEQSAQTAIAAFGQGSFVSRVEDLAPATFTLIATPDDAIPDIVDALAQNPQIQKGQIIFHCSGLLSSDVLSPLRKKRVEVASLHPFRSFAASDLSHYKGTLCTLEGDEAATILLGEMFQKIGFICYPIDKTKKALYHAAAVFASNYLITLTNEATICLEAVGFNPELSRALIFSLMGGTLSNMQQCGSLEAALTGPIARGDLTTLRQHIEVLNLSQQALYAELGKATLKLTHHEEPTKRVLEKILQER